MENQNPFLCDETTTPAPETAVQNNLPSEEPPCPTAVPDKNTQPDTQPVDSQSQELCSSLPDGENADDVWCSLEPLVSSLGRFGLGAKSYIIGRATSCSIQIPQDIVESSKYMLNVSKSHCTVMILPENSYYKLYLEDHSSNGTFVNRKHVRKEKVPLHSNDVIALGHRENRLFRVVFGEAMNFPQCILDRYRIEKLLGQGAFGQVHSAYCLRSRRKVAIKSVNHNREQKPCTDPSALLDHESSLLMQVKHPSVIRITGAKITSVNSVYLVMEFMEGGDLLGRLRETPRNRLPDRLAKLYFLQLANAVEYLHGKGIIHRDLKPENLLLASREEETLLKVSDFGLSKLADQGSVMKTFCGTPMFVAPEVLQARRGVGYRSQCDLWSMGVILFMCLTGKPPFSDKRGNLVQQILNGIVLSSPPVWEGIPREAKELVFRLLTVNPLKRIKFCDLPQHPWLDDPAVKMRVTQLYNTYELHLTRAAAKRSPLESASLAEPEHKVPRLGQ